MEVLLENDADPNLPLGKGVGNVVCALTTTKAHKARAYISVSAAVALLHKLLFAGADIFARVLLSKGKVGSVLDFAYAVFQSVCDVPIRMYRSIPDQ